MPSKKTITWVAVADGRKAIFFTKQPNQKLSSLNHTLTAQPIRTNEETRKSLGRVHDRVGPGRHITEPNIDDKTQEKQRFAEQVVDYLDESLDKQLYDRLIIIAPPKTLGRLRKLFSKPVENVIALELDKNLTHLTPLQIDEHLEKLIHI